MLEIIAILTMSIDHIGLYFFPQESIFRIIGRIAMPIYAFGIAQGFLHTKDRKKYIMRLSFLAIIAQIPYFYLHNYDMILNIIFTFTLALVLLIVLDKKVSWFIKSYCTLFILVLAEFFGFEYGSYAILLILIYRYSAKWAFFPLHAILLTIYFYGGLTPLINWYSLIATFIISCSTILPTIKINRTFYRAFYPAHLTIIALILIILNIGLLK